MPRRKLSGSFCCPVAARPLRVHDNRGGSRWAMRGNKRRQARNADKTIAIRSTHCAACAEAEGSAKADERDELLGTAIAPAN